MQNFEQRRVWTEKCVSHCAWKQAVRHFVFAVFLGVMCLLAATQVSAQSSNRWLFVFNTSAAMRDRVNGMVTLAGDLLKTGMHGNLRNGDTIGIWTYDKVLRASEVPLLTWDSKAAEPFAQHASVFLTRHRYENTAQFGDVLTNMLRVIKGSDVITVIFVSDGSDPIFGTPFDANIAAFYRTNYIAQKKARMPVVTVLRGEQGKITANTLSLGPSLVDIPAVPPPTVAKAVETKPAEEVKPKPAAPPVPSLVIIGKKAETTFNPPPFNATQETPPEEKPAPPKVEPQPVTAETPAVASAPEEKTKESTTAPVVVEPKAAPAEVAAISKPAAPAEIPAAKPAVTNEAAVQASAPPFVDAATSVPPKNLFSARNIAIVSVAFAVLVSGLLILGARSARSSSQASLITRSLDREQK